MAMAATALAIDTMLPAFPEIREGLGLAPDSTAVAGLVTAFLLGQGLGLIPAGLLADRFGRPWPSFSSCPPSPRRSAPVWSR